jgi:hypothetical protein
MFGSRFMIMSVMLVLSMAGAMPAQAVLTSFSLNSSDGSRLFIDGHFFLDNGGVHPPQTIIADFVQLTGGLHPFEVQFFKCCGGESGVDLTVGSSVVQ